MTKSEFVDQISDRLRANGIDLTKKDATLVVDEFLGTIQDALTRGSEVTFSGFGKFHVAKRSARDGVNPATGEKIKIAASKSPKFTAGSALKKAVKG